MTFAHELIHRRHGYERLFRKHPAGQRDVSTLRHRARQGASPPRGHASAIPRRRALASLYRFVPRSIVGGLISAWQIERLKLWERDTGTWSINNLMLRYAAVELAIYASIGIGLGPVALALFAGQSLVAIAVLEAINYVEHYGLLRRKSTSYEYERVKPEHSWIRRTASATGC